MSSLLYRFFFTDYCLSIHRLVQFVDSYDPPIKGLHEDLNFVSPRIGEVVLISFSIAVVITRNQASYAMSVHVQLLNVIHARLLPSFSTMIVK
jgi:hypothetical protein